MTPPNDPTPPAQDAAAQSDAEGSFDREDDTSYDPAGFVFRALAFCVDLAILTVVVQLGIALNPTGFGRAYGVLYRESTGIMATAIGSGDAYAVVFGGVLLLWIGIALVFGLLYHTAFDCSPLSGSPGKFLLGTFVARSTGERCSIQYALVRNFLKVLSALPLGFGFALALVSKRQQTLHDVLTDTMVWKPSHLPLRRLGVNAGLGALFCVLIFSLLSLPHPVPHSLKTEKLNTQPAAQITPVAATVAKKKSLGSVSFGGSTVTLADAHVRLNGNPFKKGKNIVYHDISIAFFANELTETEQRLLERAPDLAADSEAFLGRSPQVVVSLKYRSDVSTCNISSLETIEMTVTGGRAVESATDTASNAAKFTLTPDLSSISINTACLSLTPSNEFSLNFKGNYLHSMENYSWDFILTEEFQTLRPLGEAQLHSARDAITLWHPKRGILEIGLFEMEITAQDKLEIAERAKLDAVPGKTPVLWATIPLSPKTRKLSREIVQSGYSILLTRSKTGTFKFPGDKDSYTIEFTEGTFPTSLTGTLKDGGRTFGRFEGQWIKYFPDGVFRIGWSVPFNAPVIIEAE